MRFLRSGYKWAAAAIAAAAMSLGSAQAATPATIPLFVYVGPACDGAAALPKFEAAIGRKVDGASEFLDWTSTWQNLVAAANYAGYCWQGKASNLALSVPMAVAQKTPSPLGELANGNYNTYYAQIAKTLIQYGFGNAYIRVGEEFNGNWYPWAAAASPTLWIQGYQQIVKTMRAVPGANFKFIWNPALYTQQVYPDQVYPGDAYVDAIGSDAYDSSWDVGYTNPAVMWNGVDNDPWGVQAIVAFAKAHNKPLAFPEWATGISSDGHGGGDSPMYVNNMATIMSGATMAYQSYWDVNSGGYNSKFDDGTNPKAAAAYINAFGSSTAGASSTVPVLRNLGAILKGHASAYTAQPLTITCTNCSAQVLQNGPKHYEILMWNDSGAASATLSWGAKASASNIYDPTIGTDPVKILGLVSSATTALTAGKALIVAVQL